jgi:hypothetical protein
MGLTEITYFSPMRTLPFLRTAIPAALLLWGPPAQAGQGFQGLALAANAPVPAAADPAPGLSLSLGAQDWFWIGAAAVAAVPAQIRYYDMPSADTGALDRNDLWAIDRWAAGNYSPGTSLATDLLILPMAAAPMAATAWEAYRGRQRWDDAFADAFF